MRGNYIDAGLGQRFLASLIDGILILLLVFVPMLLFVILDDTGTTSWIEADDSNVDAIFNVLAIGANVAYFAGFDASRWRATPGKLVFGLQVRHVDGRPLGLPGAIGRAVARTLLLNLCGLSAFSVFMGDGRGWWNGLTNARVVKAGPDPKPREIDPGVFE